MRYALLLLLAATSVPLAQETSESASAFDGETGWRQVPFEDRKRLFAAQHRDVAWASMMERAITDKITSWDQPPVQVVGTECRETLCKISMFWSEPRLQEMGQQLSSLDVLGVDGQGPTHGVQEGNGYLWTVILRRERR